MICILALALFSVANIQAADRTWTGGGGDDFWSTSANWDAAPGAGDTLVFDGASRLSNTNDLGATAFAGITFASGAGAFTLAGNAITLGGNVSNLSSSAQTINLPMALSDDRTIYGSAAALTINGTLIDSS